MSPTHHFIIFNKFYVSMKKANCTLAGNFSFQIVTRFSSREIFQIIQPTRAACIDEHIRTSHPSSSLNTHRARAPISVHGSLITHASTGTTPLCLKHRWGERGASFAHLKKPPIPLRQHTEKLRVWHQETLDKCVCVCMFSVGLGFNFQDLI